MLNSAMIMEERQAGAEVCQGQVKLGCHLRMVHNNCESGLALASHLSF